MTPVDRERWQRLHPILDEVLDLPPDERRSRIDAVCAHDPSLRAELLALLRADAETGLLDNPSDALVESALAELDREQRHEGRLLPGARVAGRYRIVGLLGRGGMGEVYRADDLKLGQPVALKFLPVSVERGTPHIDRMLTETKLARQVSHPNVCRVYDIGEWKERHFLSMEYIDGEDLASLIRRIGHLPRQKALDIARQLCAGVDAAHQLGILHRDLKPSNVMLDGNGRVRVTDFGLAVAAAQLVGGEARAGTPAYMAPEQLDGREATVRSDVYALGLVLYELFTGRRAFQAGTIDELRRLQEESSPTNPSELVEGFDPAIERAILRCLEKDPALRPASTREVAAALPGGDPLAAALAAGETPSPELVAASGPEGALSPAVAFSVLAGALIMLLALVMLSDRASTVGWVAWPRSPDALEDHARGILQRLGYERASAGRRRLIVAANEPYRHYVRAHDRSAGRWNALREPGQFDAIFVYEQADRRMVTDLRGRLMYLLVPPPDAAMPAESRIVPDWPLLFAEAGLDFSRFQPAAPTRLPRVTADERAAWTGTLDDFGDYPVRIEAAALGGKPVFFEKVVPWDSYWDPSAPAPPATRTLDAVMGFLIAFALAVAVVLVTRNWLNGRGDRRGAFRVAAVVFCLRWAVSIFGANAVPSAREWVLLLGKALTDAAAIWCAYVALEPYARRIDPRLLVSWTRVIRGKWRDPLVGRDVLYGVVAGQLAILLWAQLYVVIPHALGLSAPPPPHPYPMGGPPYLYVLDVPFSRAILGGRHVIETIAAHALGALGIMAMVVMLVLGLKMLLRRTWIVAAAVLLIATLGGWPTAFSGMTPIAIALSIVGGTLFLWSLRYGLVTILVSWFCIGVWTNFPVTGNPDVPHFSTGLVAVLLIAGLGLYGALTASVAYKPRLSSIPEGRAA